MACQPNTHVDHTFPLTTSSDSAAYYYQLGWQQIMDEGRFAASGESWQKALDFDPDFLLAKSVMARLTTDLAERKKMLQELDAAKSQIEGPERLVLDVYIALAEFYNIRQEAPELIQEKAKEVFALAENNLRIASHQFPEDSYLKAEYIEFINSQEGAASALDTLRALRLPVELNNPFMLGYEASLLAELGKLPEALAKAQKLQELMKDNKQAISPLQTLGNIYTQMDSFKLAKPLIDQAYAMDSTNLGVARLKKRIDTVLLEAKH